MRVAGSGFGEYRGVGTDTRNIEIGLFHGNFNTPYTKSIFPQEW